MIVMDPWQFMHNVFHAHCPVIYIYDLLTNSIVRHCLLFFIAVDV